MLEEERLRVRFVRYTAGEGIQIEVTDAEVALTQARNNRATALYDYQVARARLTREGTQSALSRSRSPSWLCRKPPFKPRRDKLRRCNQR